MSKIIGIDLGTTNSVAAVFVDGEPRIVNPSPNCNVVPSIVALDPAGDWVVGEDARGQQVLNPHHTVYSIKRFMGRRHNEVESEEKLVPYPVTGKPEDFVQVRVGKKRYTPQQISSMILRSIKQMAEVELGEPITRAIVTVPAYFNDSQRQATKDSAEIAGLTVERMINEPTAAAMAYGVDQRGSRNVVIFDFGGGTFDLSAMTIGGGDFKVLAVQGNTHLGGDDFDQRIIDIVAEDFLRRERIDLRDDPMALQRLKQASQHAKAQLSTMLETRIMLPFVCMSENGAKHLDYELTRERFEAVCQDLFDECYACCRKLLQDAGLYPSNVDDVVMVGGSTRMPKVQEVAKQAFETDELDRSINPDEVVALGAAILGGVMQGDLRNINLMDVTSHSFGVEAADGRVAVLIPKDTPIPTSIKKVFSTPRDNQTSVPINVLEGDGRLACENRSLGVFRLTGIRRLPRGVPQIEVEFKIDANGILCVLATDKDTGRTQKVVVTGSAGLDAVEIQEAREATEKGVASADRRNEMAMMKHRAESTLNDTREWLKIHAAMLPGRSIDQIEAALRGLEKRMHKGDAGGMAAYVKKVREAMTPFRQAG